MRDRSESTNSGSWKSPISASSMAAGLRLEDVQWDRSGKYLIWLEGRGRRNVLVCLDRERLALFDLTRDITSRAEVNYGGGDFCVGHEEVFFASGHRLYSQRLDSVQPRLVTVLPGPIASPALSPSEDQLLLVGSSVTSDTISAVPARGSQEPVELFREDFCMQPTWHPSGRRAAWICWRQPWMPWQKSRLVVADLELFPPRLGEIHLPPDHGDDRACFQPEFSPDGRYLSYVADQGGWFNLRVLELKSWEIVAEFREEAEHAVPAWVHGLRTHVWAPDSRTIHLVRNSKAACRLVDFDPEKGRLDSLNFSVPAPYNQLRQPSVRPQDGAIAMIAAGVRTPPEVAILEHHRPPLVIRRSQSSVPPPDYCSQPEALEWRSPDGSTCFGLYSPPRNPSYTCSGLPPAIIKIHGGPTSQYWLEYDADTLFFTSRGYGVLALNYQGSSGYGREYCNRLHERWGELDVQDTKGAYGFLIQSGRADPSRVVLSGGSAGGLTVLLTLVRYPRLFAAGICRYGVSDLGALVKETHRFEAGYLSSLIGAFEAHPERYRDRSPLYSADRIIDPVALFQGSDDKVVPRSQSDRIAESFRRRGIPHVYRVYEGEGHGWRKRDTIRDYYDTTERFLLEHVIERRAEQ